MTDGRDILVATCGNLAAGDDGFGPRLAELLRQEPLPGVKLLDLATRGDDLLEDYHDAAMLILVDAAFAPFLEPGEVMECSWRTGPRPEPFARTPSTHGFSPARHLELADQLGLLPENVLLLCVGAGRVDLGQGLSHEVEAALPRVRTRIAQLASSSTAFAATGSMEIRHGTNNHD